MAGNNLLAFKTADKLAVSLAKVSVAGAVEAVSSDGVLLIVFIGKTKDISLGRHGLMEGSIKNSNQDMSRDTMGLTWLGKSYKIYLIRKRHANR